MLTVADTDYDLSGAHSEVMITQTEFSRKYKAFFIHDLLESKVLLARGDAEDVRGFDRNREKRINAGGFTQLPIKKSAAGKKNCG